MNSETIQPTEKVTESNASMEGQQYPEVELPRKDRVLAEFALDMGKICCEHGVYLQDGVPVVLEPTTNRITPLTADCFRTFAEKFLRTISISRVQKKNQDGSSSVEFIPHAESMNKMQASAVLSSYQFLELQKHLRRISLIPIPIIDSGKLTLQGPGYNPHTKILVKADAGRGYDLMPKEAAVDFLKDFLREFPFADDDGLSLSCQVAAMVTRFAVSLLPEQAQAPMFVWNANGPAAGKSLLAQVVEIPVRGQAPMRSFPEEKQELAKVLDSEVLAGSDSIIFDNVKIKLDSPYLEQFVTSSVVATRRLGGSTKQEVGKQTMVMVTTNQAEVSADIARRSIFIDLFQKEADPQARKIERPMGAEYLARPDVRYAILSALWSLVVAWDAAGRKVGSTRLVGFEAWSDVIGGIVENAGFGSPLRRPSSDNFGDFDAQDMESLVRAMHEGVFRDAIELNCRDGITFEDLIWICRDRGLFDGSIVGRTDRETKEFEMFNRSRSIMGRLFEKYNKRVFRFDDLGAVTFDRVGSKNRRRFRIC
jgi:hypothetical protein